MLGTVGAPALATVPGRPLLHQSAVVPPQLRDGVLRAWKKPRLQTHPVDGSLAMSGDYRTMHFTQGRTGNHLTSQEPPHLGSQSQEYHAALLQSTPEILREATVIPQSVGPRTQSQRFCMACGDLPTDGQVLLVCASRGCENAVDLNCFTFFQNWGTYGSGCWWCPLHSLSEEALVEDGDDDFDEDNEDEFFDDKRGQGGKAFHRGGNFSSGRGTGATDAPPPSQYGLSSGPSEASVSVGCTRPINEKIPSHFQPYHTTGNPLSPPSAGNLFWYWAC